MEPSHFETLYPARSWFDTVAAIFHLVQEGNSCQLIGLPGVGRANILNLLAYNYQARKAHVGDNQKWFHFVTVDFSEVRNKPLYETTKLLFLELIDSLHERKLETEYETTAAIFKESLGFQDELVLFQGLKKTIDYLAIEKELTIVFLIERFDEYVPMLDGTFFSNLRILRNKAKYRFSVVLSLTRPLEELVDPLMLADFYEFVTGHMVYVPLHDTEVSTFRLQYLEKVSGKKIATKDADTITHLTGFHGKLTRLCNEIFLSSNEPVTAALFLSKKSVIGALTEIWYFLRPAEQQEIQDALRNATDITNVFLQEIDLVRDGKLTIPLFADFVAHLPQETVQEEKIVLDPITSIVTKGSQTISDQLTNAEYRLLVLLLQHEGEIVERESLIQAVWKDAATTMGVTDQAVDQLLFRLRKKIEENPTQPTHILTIKGRGVKYQQ